MPAVWPGTGTVFAVQIDDQATWAKNMQEFKARILNIFERYGEPEENDILNITTMEYTDDPVASGEMKEAEVATDASENSDLSDVPGSALLLNYEELKSPATSDMLNKTFYVFRKSNFPDANLNIMETPSSPPRDPRRNVGLLHNTPFKLACSVLTDEDFPEFGEKLDCADSGKHRFQTAGEQKNTELKSPQFVDLYSETLTNVSKSLNCSFDMMASKPNLYKSSGWLCKRKKVHLAKMQLLNSTILEESFKTAAKGGTLETACKPQPFAKNSEKKTVLDLKPKETVCIDLTNDYSDLELIDESSVIELVTMPDPKTPFLICCSVQDSAALKLKKYKGVLSVSDHSSRKSAATQSRIANNQYSLCHKEVNQSSAVPPIASNFSSQCEDCSCNYKSDHPRKKSFQPVTEGERKKTLEMCSSVTDSRRHDQIKAGSPTMSTKHCSLAQRSRFYSDKDVIADCKETDSSPRRLTVTCNYEKRPLKKDGKSEINFETVYRICSEKKSPDFKRTFLSSKSLGSLAKSNALSSPFYKKVKRDHDFKDDYALQPTVKKIKVGDSHFYSSEILDNLFKNVTFCSQEKSTHLPKDARIPSEACRVDRCRNLHLKMDQNRAPLCKTSLSPSVTCQGSFRNATNDDSQLGLSLSERPHSSNRRVFRKLNYQLPK